MHGDTGLLVLQRSDLYPTHSQSIVDMHIREYEIMSVHVVWACPWLLQTYYFGFGSFATCLYPTYV